MLEYGFCFTRVFLDSIVDSIGSEFDFTDLFIAAYLHESQCLRQLTKQKYL